MLIMYYQYQFIYLLFLIIIIIIIIIIIYYYYYFFLIIIICIWYTFSINLLSQKRVHNSLTCGDQRNCCVCSNTSGIYITNYRFSALKNMRKLYPSKSICQFIIIIFFLLLLHVIKNYLFLFISKLLSPFSCLFGQLSIQTYTQFKNTNTLKCI